MMSNSVSGRTLLKSTRKLGIYGLYLEEEFSQKEPSSWKRPQELKAGPARKLDQGLVLPPLCWWELDTLMHGMLVKIYF